MADLSDFELIDFGGLPTVSPAGTHHLMLDNGATTGKNTIDNIVAAAQATQDNAAAIAANAAAISSLNSKFVVAGDVASVQFGVTDTNLQIRFDCGTARGVYFFNIHRGTAQVSLMRTYNGQTTTIWTLT